MLVCNISDLSTYADAELQVFTRGMVKHSNYMYMDYLSGLNGYGREQIKLTDYLKRDIHPPQPRGLGFRTVRSPRQNILQI